MKRNFFVFASISLLLGACTFEKVQPLPVGCNTTIFFSTDIKPIINSYCISCHTTGAVMGDFNDFSVLKSKVDAGVLKTRVFIAKDMPPAGNPQLTEEELAKLKCWMEQGAPNN